MASNKIELFESIISEYNFAVSQDFEDISIVLDTIYDTNVHEISQVRDEEYPGQIRLWSDDLYVTYGDIESITSDLIQKIDETTIIDVRIE